VMLSRWKTNKGPSIEAIIPVARLNIDEKEEE